ncbi:MAG: hypothetical protein RBT72_01315 [Spirochaetia bacterium]|jgi:ribosomal protein S18 acetylase RimI-like enzyme|nr:hypothetical protein [Spirochaetia bacterium]
MQEHVDTQELEKAAGRTGVFKAVEIDLLHETLLSWKNSPGDPYTVLELRDGKSLVAFAIISRISGRESTYDIRYLVVDRDYRSTEGGKHLLQLIDDELLANSSYAVIRLESSGLKLLNIGPDTLTEAGYKIIGHIESYYGENNDYYYLIKTAYRNPPKFTKPESPVSEDGSSDAKPVDSSPHGENAAGQDVTDPA